MLMEIVIDRATPLDAGLLVTLHKSCFPRPWDEAAMATFIASPDTLCLLGSVNHQTEPAPAGFLIARKAADEAELLTLAVVPGRRRAGVARALLTAAMAMLAESGAKQLLFEVEEGNDAAVEIYRSLGATVVGRRARYYEHGADAVIFSLAL